MDFPDTRDTLARLTLWFHAVADRVGRPIPVREDDRLYYLYPDKSPSVVIVAKAARMISGLNAAMRLADLGYVVESAVILRTITDFANEILAIIADLSKGELGPAAQKFCDQFFTKPPTTTDEFLAQERERYVTRGELYKSHRRAAEEAGQDADMLLNESRFLDKGYDSYVHGGYRTAMQLYDPTEEQFALGGTYSDHHICVAKVGIAGKLYYSMIALELAAHFHGLDAIADDIKSCRTNLEKSPEYDGRICH